MTEHEIRDLFREMREEPVPADSLARVRARVDQRRRPQVVLWKILAALAAAACIVLGFLILRPAKPVQQISAPEIAQVGPAAPVRDSRASRP